MSGKKTINNIRRRVLGQLTRTVGKHNARSLMQLNPATIERILILRPNHRLGNMLLTTPLVQEIEQRFPNASIDFFVKGFAAPVIYKEYTSVKRFIHLPKKHFKEPIRYVRAWLALRSKPYDLVINLTPSSSSGRLATQFARATHRLFGDEMQEASARFADAIHMAKTPIYNLRLFLNPQVDPSIDLPTMSLRLSDTEKERGKALLNQLISDPGKPTIALYTFATGAKCYSDAWWMPFLEQIKERFSNHNLLEILPVENVSQIHFSIPSLYSKDIREMAAVLAHCAVFVTADCGIMHLGSAAPVATIGLFSVTNPAVYEPYNPGSCALKTENLKMEQILDQMQEVNASSISKCKI